MTKLEILYLFRYASSGVANTLLGFFVIFAAMALGASPLLSNIAGYATGFLLGFLLSKKFVFRSNGHYVKESLRYLLAFIISFLCNILALHILLSCAQMDPVFGQLGAAIVYTVTMYLFVRFFVFRT